MKVEPRDDETPSGLRSLLGAAVVGWALFTVLNASAGGRPSTVALDSIVVVATTVLLVSVLRQPRAWRFAVHGAALLSTAGLVLAAWWSGGVESVAVWYLVAVPLFVSHLAGRRAGLAWCVIACAAGVVAATDPLAVRPEFVPSTVDRVFGSIVLTAVCTSFGWLARRAVDERIEHLSAAARTKSELLATISHEIRTPLHGILGVATVLSETSLSTDQRELVTALRASGKTLHRIVDDVLDVARLELGKLAIDAEPVDLLSTLEDVVDLHASDAAAKGLSLTLVPDGAEHFSVIVDETRVRQIVSNLVSNAVKFTASGSVIVRASARSAGARVQIELRVEDTGPGFPADRIDRLFTAYDRLDTKLARLHGGTGLGLALARDLAVRMGGSLDAERDRPAGACLVLRLDAPAHPTDAIAPGTALVLVVEPDETCAAAARALARAMPDLELVVTGSVPQAVAFATGRRVAAVIVGASKSFDAVAARADLARVVGEGTPIVLGISPASVGAHSSVSRSFSGTTLKPLRRSRLRAIVSEVVQLADVPAASSHRSALVVDDDATNRSVLGRLLTNRGWAVISTDSGAAGLAALGERAFEAVLCDLHMPEMDGLKFVARARDLGHASYYVAATASVRESDRDRCLAAGFDGFLRKPFEPAELDEVLGAAVRTARASSASARQVALPLAGELVHAEKWHAARALMGDEHDSVVREHVEAARKHIATVRANADDPEIAERAGHTLASGSLMLGLQALGEAARALELAARSLDARGRIESADVLSALLDASIAHARTLRVAPAREDVADVLEVRLEGRVSAAMVIERLDAAERAALGSPRGMLVDCRAMTGYDDGTRRAFESWHLGRRERLRSVAVLTENRLWHAVVQGIALVTGQRMRGFERETEARAWLASAPS